MIDSLVDLNRSLKVEADDLLNNKKLLQTLRPYGKPHVAGSYFLDLMTWRDLDIYLEIDAMTQDRFFALGGQLSEVLQPTRMQFRNETLANTQGLPFGLYWGIYLSSEGSQPWKIDIWAVEENECRRLLLYCDNIRQQLDKVSSQIILSIKSECCQDPDYRRLYTSTDIYESVLQGGVKDIDGFWKYLDGSP